MQFPFNSEIIKIYVHNTNVKFQLICFNETWSKSYKEDDVCFNSNKSVVASRQGDLVVGGVSLLIKDDTENEPIPTKKFLFFTCFSSFEFMSVMVF